MQRRLLVAAPLLVAILVVILIVLVTQRTASTPPRTTVAALTTTAPPNRPVALTGYVQRSSRHYEGQSQWGFTLEDSDGSVTVRYTGVVPSTFEEGAFVMVVGTMDGRMFVATQLSVRM
jgi:cytochrome c-type biogenesis protein CcmE